MDLNKIQIIGNVARDVVMRQTPNGINVANFSVATSSKLKDSSGNVENKLNFHNVVVWGKTAEIANEYLKKGKRVYVEGRLSTGSWDDENGVKHYKTEINAFSFIMLNGSSNKIVTDDLDRTQVIGNVASDIEVKKTPTGKDVLSFSVASNRKWKDQNGEEKEEAEFHRIVAWEELANEIAKNIKKGNRIYLEGKTLTRSYEDKNGNKKYATETLIRRKPQLFDVKDFGGNNTENNDDIPLPTSSPTAEKKADEDFYPEDNVAESSDSSGIDPKELPF